jgi:FMN phosphatase YigB (HAD superfamily)
LEKKVFHDWFQVFKNLKIFPGLKDLLEDLKKRQIPLGVMSDFPIRGRLQDLGVGDYWKIAFSSEDTGYLKPHRKPFEWISELMHVPIPNILYVGNSFRYDVLGAKSVGMMAAHVAKKAPKIALQTSPSGIIGSFGTLFFPIFKLILDKFLQNRCFFCASTAILMIVMGFERGAQL